MKNYNTLTYDRLKKMLEKYKIKWIDNYIELKNLIYLKTTLPITFCSKNKSNRDNVTPREFYISARNLRFYDFCDKFNLNYGILSDKYGLLFKDDKIKNYDLRPSDLTIEDKKRIGEDIRTKCIKNNISDIIIYNSSPMMTVPYFEMLNYSSINFYFLSDLKLMRFDNTSIIDLF